MRSDAFKPPFLSAGPAGTKRRTEVYSSCISNTAPMPSSERDMLMLKFSEVRGEKYWVCGS